MHGKFKTRFLAPASHLLKGVGASALSLLIGSTLLDHTAQPGVAPGAREARPALPASAPFAGNHGWWGKNSPPPPGDGLKRNERNGERQS